MDVTLAELARLVAGDVVGDAELRLTGMAGLDTAGAADLCFLRAKAPAKALAGTAAGAVVVGPEVEAPGLNLLRVAAPETAFNRIARAFGPKTPEVPEGVHATAIVDAAAAVDPSVRIGPYVVVEPGARIAAGTQVGAFCYVGHDVTIGENCRLFPHVVVREGCLIGNRVVLEVGCVVGADGFGWEAGPEGPQRIPQIGRVVLEDGVELGANTTVDRARLDETRIATGSKLDNLVQVGHNVTIGAYNMFAAQVGLAGMSKTGKGVELGGQVGVAGHLTIGDGAKCGAKSGIPSDVEPGAVVFGFPALPARLAMRIHALKQRLPEMVKRLKELEQKVADLEKSADA